MKRKIGFLGKKGKKNWWKKKSKIYQGYFEVFNDGRLPDSQALDANGGLHKIDTLKSKDSKLLSPGSATDSKCVKTFQTCHTQLYTVAYKH